MNAPGSGGKRSGGGGRKGDMHIVLISLYHFGAFGARILADVLKREGYLVSLVFFKRDKTNEMALPTAAEYALLDDLLKRLAPDLVGLSVRSAFFPVAAKITAGLKPALRAPVVWGGPHAIICPEECVLHADIVCTGEGEGPLPRLAAALLDGTDYSGLPGFWVKKPDGSVSRNGRAPLTEDLDSLPPPDFSDMSRSYVIEDGACENTEPVYNERLVHYNFMTGRGCPFSCDFCSNSALHSIFGNKGRRCRQRSVGNVLGELAAAKKAFKNLSSVSVNDELFGMDPKWLAEFCSRYKKEIGLAFHCDMHPAFVTEEKIAALSGIGLRTISMGVQSGSEKLRLELFGRNTPDAMIRNAASLFRKYGIFPSYDLILDIPGETEDDVRLTLDFMLGLPGPFRLNLYSLQHHPRTVLTEKLLASGRIAKDDVDGVSLKGFDSWHIRVDRRSGPGGKIFLQRLLVMLGSNIQLSKKDPGRAAAIFPRRLIRSMEKSRILRENPWLTDWVSHLPRLAFAAGLVFQLDFSGFFLRVFRRLRKGAAGALKL